MVPPNPIYWPTNAAEAFQTAAASSPLTKGTEFGSVLPARKETMPSIARRPFFSSARRFSAFCSSVSAPMKPRGSQNLIFGVQMPLMPSNGSESILPGTPSAEV